MTTGPDSRILALEAIAGLVTDKSTNQYEVASMAIAIAKVELAKTPDAMIEAIEIALEAAS